MNKFVNYLVYADNKHRVFTSFEDRITYILENEESIGYRLSWNGFETLKKFQKLVDKYSK